MKTTWDGSASTHRHAAAAPGTYGQGLSGPGTTGAARAELGMNWNVQPHHHHGTIRQRPVIHSPTNTGSDSGPSHMTRDEDDGDEYDYKEQEGLGDDMVLGCGYFGSTKEKKMTQYGSFLNFFQFIYPFYLSLVYLGM